MASNHSRSESSLREENDKLVEKLKIMTEQSGSDNAHEDLALGSIPLVLESIDKLPDTPADGPGKGARKHGRKASEVTRDAIAAAYKQAGMGEEWEKTQKEAALIADMSPDELREYAAKKGKGAGDTRKGVSEEAKSTGGDA